MKKIKIGLVGATGLVGDTFVQILNELEIAVEELRPFASAQSIGKTIQVGDQDFPVRVLEEGCFEGLDLVFFSSGDDISLEWGPKAVAAGAYAVDNSAAFRMNIKNLLCVPEVNGHKLKELGGPALIANPNCSTIQLVVALRPLQQKFGLQDVRVASYQSVSGAGREALNDLVDQSAAVVNGEEMPEGQVFKTQIAFNTYPQIGSIGADFFCSEEVKIMNETKKILDQPELTVSAFTVRVPTINSHAEAVWVTLKEEASLEDVKNCLSSFKGIRFIDSGEPSFPTMVLANGENDVLVGRLKKDPNYPRTFQMWVVADNLRKGAAYNGIQIAQAIFA